jgi:hypothetical protein
MKRINILLVAVLLTTAVYAQEGQLKIPLTKPGEAGRLSVDINSGSITVKGSDVKQVIINYSGTEHKVGERENKSRSGSEGLNKVASNALDLEAAEKDNHVMVESDSWNKGVDLVIEVPRNFDLHLEGYNNGFIQVNNVTGEIEAEHYNGKITLENISGSVVAETYNGAITITYDKVTPNTPMAYSTYNGNIDLTFPASTALSFKMKTKQGDIYEGFDMTLEQEKTSTATERSKSGVYKVQVDNWVRGKINGGGAEVTIQSYNGDIFLRKGN